MNIKATIDGEELEFEMLDEHEHSSHYIDRHGDIRETGDHRAQMVPLRLICKRHTFGGIVFEEGGLEYDVKGKWVLGHGPTYAEWSDQTIAYRVLHPVTLED